MCAAVILPTPAELRNADISQHWRQPNMLICTRRRLVAARLASRERPIAELYVALSLSQTRRLSDVRAHTNTDTVTHTHTHTGLRAASLSGPVSYTHAPVAYVSPEMRVTLFRRRRAWFWFWSRATLLTFLSVYVLSQSCSSVVMETTEKYKAGPKRIS